MVSVELASFKIPEQRYCSWQYFEVAPPSGDVSPGTHTWVDDLVGTTLNLVQSPSLFSSQYGISSQALVESVDSSQ